MKRVRWGLPVYTAVVAAILLLPIAVMILFGFNDPQGRFNLTWSGFTLKWYRRLFAVPELAEALRNSLVVAVVATVTSVTLGTAMALAFRRRRFRGRGPAWLLVLLPIATPEVVLGAALLSMLVTVNASRGFATILAAHVMFSLSYVVLTVRARLHGRSDEIEEAARDLGASAFTAFRTVTLPSILPAVLAAAALAFALSIDDFVITSFIAGQTVTFPLWVWGASRFGVPPQVNVMGTLLFVSGLVVTVLALKVSAGSGRGTITANPLREREQALR